MEKVLAIGLGNTQMSFLRVLGCEDESWAEGLGF